MANNKFILVFKLFIVERNQETYRLIYWNLFAVVAPDVVTGVAFAVVTVIVVYAVSVDIAIDVSVVVIVVVIVVVFDCSSVGM